MNIIKVFPPSTARFFIDVSPHDVLDLRLVADGASYDRVGNDVVISLDDGGNIFLLNFFITNASSEDLPQVKIDDTGNIDGGLFLIGENPYIDLRQVVAKPEEDSVLQSGGVGEYQDGAGEIIAGLESSGDRTAGAAGAGTSLGHSDILQQNFAYAAPPAAPAAPLPPPLPPTPGGAYQARAVAYAAASGSAEARFRLLDNSGTPVANSHGQPNAITQNDYFDLNQVTQYPDGSISYALSAIGQAALTAANGADIFDYITFSYDGRSYTMQVVVNPSGSYTPNDSAGGWTPQNLYGEWHYGANVEVGGTINATVGNDQFWFSNVSGPGVGTAFSGTLNLLGGNNSLSAEGGAYALDGASITAGAGKDAITLRGGSAAMHNSGLNTGAGDDSVKISSGGTGIWADSGQSAVIAREGGVSIDVDADANGYGVLVSGAGNSVLLENAGLDIDIGASTTGYSLAGLFANSGEISVSSGSAAPVGLSIDVSQSSGNVYGVITQNGGEAQLQNVKAESGQPLINASTDTGSAYALRAYLGDIVISGDGSSGKTTLSAKGSATAYTVYAAGSVGSSGSASISDFDHLEITAKSTGSSGWAAGLMSSGDDVSLEISDVNKLSILAEANSSNSAMGLHAGGKMTLGSAGRQIGEIDINAVNSYTGAYSPHAKAITSNSITDALEITAGKISLSATAANGQARGISTEGGGYTKISSDGALDISINVSGPGNSGGSDPYYQTYGIYSGRTFLTRMSTTEIIGGQGGSQADVINISGGGVMASHGGINKITTGAGDDVLNLYSLTARGTPDAQTGSSRATHNIINVGAGNNTITANNGGISAEDRGHNEFIFSGGGHNSVNGGDIAANASPNAYAASNHFYNDDAAGAFNILLGTSVNPADIIAGYRGSNTFDTVALDQADSLTFYGSFTASNSYSYDGAIYNNLISTEGGNDSVTIYGDLSASGYGKNIINAGDGDDTVSISGNIIRSGTNSANTVSTGDGDDTLILRGQVGVGALNVDMGAGNGDTLILQAHDAAQFSDYYRDWLSGTSLDGVENIVVNMSSGSLADLDWLTTHFGSSGISVNFHQVVGISLFSGPALLQNLAAAQNEASFMLGDSDAASQVAAAITPPVELDAAMALDMQLELIKQG